MSLSAPTATTTCSAATAATRSTAATATTSATGGTRGMRATRAARSRSIFPRDLAGLAREAVLPARRPLGQRPLLELAVDLEVGALVEEREVVLDPHGVVARLAVRPYEVLLQPVADPHRPVAGEALVGAAGLLLTWLEQLGAHVVIRDVPARRQSGLEQPPGAPRLGEQLAVEADLDVARGVEDVDPVVRIACVDHRELVLLVPLVHRRPAERDQPLERRGRLGRVGEVVRRVVDRSVADPQ